MCNQRDALNEKSATLQNKDSQSQVMMCGESPGPNYVFTSLSFSAALEHLKKGRKIKRASWGGHWFLSKDARVSEILPDTYTRGYAFKELIVAVLANDGGCAPATPYQSDLLAEDWESHPA